jgi:RecB family exonuclease
MKHLFLGNDKPLLHRAADYLIDRFYQQGRLDFRHVILTLQEQRAINRLEEILAERAEEIDCAWYPPEFLAIGTLPERFYELKKPIANELTQYFAWLVAIDQLDDEHPDLLRRLIPSPPDRGNLEARLAMGRMFAKLHRELAAGTLDFIHVADLCRKLNIGYETSRWEALDQLQKKYLARLDSLGIWDVQSARLYALEHVKEFEPQQSQFQQEGTQILLIGVVDMNLAQKEMLRHFGDFVTSLIFAPEHWRDRFDDLGCLIPHIWQEATIELHDQQIHIVESVSDQAEEVLRCLVELNGNYAPPEIIVGVPDKQVVPFIERQFEQAQLKTRIVAGKSIRQTPSYRFLETLLPFLEAQEAGGKAPAFAHFAALVRHPDVEIFVKTVLQHKLSQPINLISELDQYYMEFLPAGLETLAHSDSLYAVQQCVQKLLAPQEPSSAQASTAYGLANPASEMSNRLHSILRTLFPPPRRDEAYQQILDTLSQIQEVPSELFPHSLSFPDTIRLVLTQIEHATIPMPHEPKAVELVGWLDLAMDDAEVIIVTGMNDGSVPTFQTSDMFLPDTMRQQLSRERRLSIEDNSRRYARDAYALSCLLATRQHDPQRTQFIGSRRSVEGDPMLPSRLFFAADDERVTKRVRHFFSEKQEIPPPLQFPRREKQTPITFDSPEIPEGAGRAIRAMNVTDFAEYKKCPYRYYLKCCLKPRLQSVNDTDTELHAGAFGSLIHDVLESFGKTEGLNHSTSAETIRDFLVSKVRELTHHRYGPSPRPVVAIQAERAVKRLEAFAGWQANWAKEHEILTTELQFQGDQFSLDVDNDIMLLHGRIDRIDRNKKTNSLVIWDYKTGKSETPKGHLWKGEWINFQLPLYYHLLEQHTAYSDFLHYGFQLGYIVLPSDTTKTGDVLAHWDRPIILSAVEEAREIVRRIWKNEFPKTTPPPKHSEAFATICNDF